ncbi:hypothetical protein [Paraflavitalea speifideaquila]|uniref:hypothetical protein n=1 Tax=Paraflavitalea speifideaquila TaxID=3076558 RepID=UPI0028EFA300|nr:hypothetical protein [Paraflavitalea speifideiaquila]
MFSFDFEVTVNTTVNTYEVGEGENKEIVTETITTTDIKILESTITFDAEGFRGFMDLASRNPKEYSKQSRMDDRQGVTFLSANVSMDATILWGYNNLSFGTGWDPVGYEVHILADKEKEPIAMMHAVHGIDNRKANDFKSSVQLKSKNKSKN